MARSRNLKPGFFTDADLLECSFEARILFEGLWVHADRRGILADNAKQIKIDIFPADDVDVEPMLTELADHGLILRYTVEGQRCIWIPNFLKHQSPHPKEPENGLPAPHLAESLTRHLLVSDKTLSDPASSLFPLPSSTSLLPHPPPPRERPRRQASCRFEHEVGADRFMEIASNLTEVSPQLDAGWLREVLGELESEGVELGVEQTLDALQAAFSVIRDALGRENSIRHPRAYGRKEIRRGVEAAKAVAA